MESHLDYIRGNICPKIWCFKTQENWHILYYLATGKLARLTVLVWPCESLYFYFQVFILFYLFIFETNTKRLFTLSMLTDDWNPRSRSPWVPEREDLILRNKIIFMSENLDKWSHMCGCLFFFSPSLFLLWCIFRACSFRW